MEIDISVAILICTNLVICSIFFGYNLSRNLLNVKDDFPLIGIWFSLALLVWIVRDCLLKINDTLQ